MAVQFFQVDAFTAEPYRGNPAGVCLLKEEKSAEWMQAVAAEINLSETAFLILRSDGYGLRWFTPRVEVELCGHATLASAHALWQAGVVDRDELIFHTLSGELRAQRAGDWIELNFPALAFTEADPPRGYLQALGIEPLQTVMFGERYLFEIRGEENVRNLTPDFSILANLPGRGVIVTSRAQTSPCDFVSRYFAPWIGINEDPVTGSAHCCLGPYWQQKLGKDDLLAWQVSLRGGVIQVRPRGARVILAGKAVTVLEGQLLDV